MAFRQWSVLPLLFSVFYAGNCLSQGIIIVHPSVQETSLPLNTLRAIFSMQKTRWRGGAKISVYILNTKNKDNAAIHNAFVTSVLALLPHQLKKAWDRNIFSGIGEKPYSVKDVGQMLHKISSIPGAIGYLPEKTESMPVTILSVGKAR